MKPLDATKHMNALNKVIQGSQQIIDAIDADKEINIKKALRASMINAKILAEELKIALGEVVKFDNPSDNGLFNDLMKGFGK